MKAVSIPQTFGPYFLINSSKYAYGLSFFFPSPSRPLLRGQFLLEWWSVDPTPPSPFLGCDFDADNLLFHPGPFPYLRTTGCFFLSTPLERLGAKTPLFSPCGAVVSSAPRFPKGAYPPFSEPAEEFFFFLVFAHSPAGLLSTRDPSDDFRLPLFLFFFGLASPVFFFWVLVSATGPSNFFSQE